jgi:uncharacterized LabA/DUF88 family protein
MLEVSPEQRFLLPLPYSHDLARAMIFVDGENLTLRYKHMLRARGEQSSYHLVYDADGFIWSKYFVGTRGPGPSIRPSIPVMRSYYYTSVRGDEPARHEAEDRLKEIGIDAPMIFPKSKNERSKRVDITLSVDMLIHAVRKNCDVAILFTGDEDFYPLIRAVQGEGARVVLCALSSGLSRKLRMIADEFVNLDPYFFPD